jgi:outer membrane protein assembly factor BamB
MAVAIGSAGSAPSLYDLSAAGAVTFSEAFGQAGFASSPGMDDYGTLYLADAHGGSAACGGIDGGDPYTALAFSSDGGSLAQVAGLALPFSKVSGTFGVAVDANETSYWGNNGQFFAVSSPASGFKQVAAWPACGVSLTSPSVNAVSNLALDFDNTGNLYAYSAWETSAPDGGYSVQGNIAALNPATGAQLWIFDIPAATLPVGWTPLQSDVGNASPAVAIDGTVYVGGGLGLYALDGATGAQQWLFPSVNVSSSPAIGGDGTIFFGCDDGSFYAVTPTGQLRFMVPTGGPISSSPAIDGDGTVYFVSDDGNLYAID